MHTILANFIYVVNFVSFLPIYRFRKTSYYIFFLTCAFINPVIMLIGYTFHISSYYCMPFIAGAMLMALPGLKWKIQILFSLFAVAVLVSFYKENIWIPLLTSSLSSFYLLFYFSQKIIDEYKKSFSVTLFLPVLWVESLKDVILVYLYFCHLNLFLQLFTGFSVVAFISPLLVTYFGTDKKYFFKKEEKKIIEVSEVEENLKPQAQQSTVAKEVIPQQVITEAEPEKEIPEVVSESANEVEEFLKGLKEREIVILYYLSQGFDEQEISDKMALGIKSIYTYIAKLKEKLNVKTMAKLYHYAITNGEKISKTSIIQKLNSR